MKTQYLIGAAIIVATGGAVVWQAASPPLAAPAKSEATMQTAAIQAVPILDGVMRPSEFPGVQTASIPDAPAVSSPKTMKNSSDDKANGKAWVRVLPGGRIPEGGYTGRGATTWRRENGKTPLGGIALIPDGDYLLHEVAKRDKNGTLIHECTPDESAAQHFKHRAKAKANRAQKAKN